MARLKTVHGTLNKTALFGLHRQEAEGVAAWMVGISRIPPHGWLLVPTREIAHRVRWVVMGGALLVWRRFKGESDGEAAVGSRGGLSKDKLKLEKG